MVYKLEKENNSIKGFLEGSKLSLPIVAGYLPLGFAAGIVCTDAGMTTFQIVLMSFLVFAGAGQYIAGGMLAAGASPFSIIVTTFIVNSRHILYTSVLYPYVSKWSFFKQSLFATQITDEVFALHSSYMPKNGVKTDTAFGINITSHSAWILGNGLGGFFSDFISDSSKYGIDFTLYALFIALVMPRIKNKIKKPLKINLDHLFAFISGGIGSVIFAYMGFPYLGIVMGGLIGAFVGYYVLRKVKYE